MENKRKLRIDVYNLQCAVCYCSDHIKTNFFFFLITDFIALIAVNNLLDIQLLPSIPSY